ncbi:MAG: efflux RND transporter periplasmic adaptor subunit [Candidatus Eiseniibacteriota bacterium]
MKKVLIAAGAVVVLGVVIALNVQRAREKAVSVEIVSVGRKTLVETVSGSGRIEARKSVSITSRVVGKVLEVNAEEGDRVEAGTVILRIDPGERQAALDQATANLARGEASVALAEAELRKAEFELERVKGLVSAGLSSAQAMESAETSHAVASARVREAQELVRAERAAVAQSRYELDKTVIVAEIPGVIVRLSVEEGENVLAGDLYNEGSPIVVIADLSEMEAQILVDETEVVKVRDGQTAEVEVDAFPDRKLSGRVFEVGNSAYNAGPLGSQEAKDFRVRILLEEVPESLRPGLSARAEVETDRREDALAVPIAALTIRDPEEEREKAEGRRSKRGRAEAAASASAGDTTAADTTSAEETREKEGVFVVRDGRAVFFEVETGIAGEKDFEVVSGLAEGDEIVQGPFEAVRTLDSGAKVKRQSSKKAKGGKSDGGEDEGAGEEAESPGDE